MQSRFIITHPKKTDQTINFIAMGDDGNPYDWDSYISKSATLYIAKLGQDPFASISAEPLEGHDGQMTFTITNDNSDINSQDVGEYVWWVVVNIQTAVTEEDIKITNRGRFILYAPNWVSASP